MSLISEIKEGNENTFREIFEQYERPLKNFIFEKTHSKYCAEEIVQLTFIKLWKYRKQLREDVKLSTQIFRIARTTIIDEMRRLKVKYKFEEYLNSLPLRSSESSGEKIILYKEMLVLLNELVETLPPMRKEVFVMSRFEFLSHKEISKKLNISTKTVENHINLALKHIKPYFN